mgnify:CR=1 FL=1
MSMIDRFKKAAGIAGDDAAEADEEDRDDQREAMVAATMRLCRNKLIAAGLIGEVSIERTVSAFTSRAICQVNEGDKATVEKITDELDHKYTRIIQMFDGAVSNLMKRAKKWDNCGDIIPNITLARAYTIGITDPIFGVVGFSMAVVVQVSLASLIKYRKQQAGLQSQSALSSSFSGMGMGHQKA